MKLHYENNVDAVTVTLYKGEKFSDEGKEVISSVEFPIADVPSELKDGDAVKSLASYGLLKLLQDRTSQEKDPEGKVALMQEYFSSFFTQGLWKRPATERAPSAGGSRRKVGASLAEAVARLQGCSAIQAESAIKALSKEDYDALVANERVKEMVKEVEAEAGGDIDLSNL